MTDDISRERFIRNGMDIAEVFGAADPWTEQILSASIGFVHTSFVQFLNDNGHPLAAQALDDAWHEREEQWWREPNGFDGRYMHGEELLNYRENNEPE